MQNEIQHKRQIEEYLNITQKVLHAFGAIAVLITFASVFLILDYPFQAPIAGIITVLLLYAAGQTHKNPIVAISALILLSVIYLAIVLFLIWLHNFELGVVAWILTAAFGAALAGGLYFGIRGKQAMERYFPDKTVDDTVLDA